MQIRYNSRLGLRLPNGLLPAVWLAILSCDGLATSQELPPQLTKTATRQASPLANSAMIGRWPDNIVYYSLGNASPAAQQAFRRAADQITQHSRARFIERPHDKTDYIYLTRSPTELDCFIRKGRGPQRIGAGPSCQAEEKVLPLLLEVLGVYFPSANEHGLSRIRVRNKLARADIEALDKLFPPKRGMPYLPVILTKKNLPFSVAPLYQSIPPDSKRRAIYFSLPPDTVAGSVSGKIYNFERTGRPDLPFLTDPKIEHDKKNPKYYIASFLPVREGRAEIHLYFQDSTGKTGMALSDIRITKNKEYSQLVNQETRQCLAAGLPKILPVTPMMKECQDTRSQAWQWRDNGKLLAGNNLCLHHDNFNRLKLVACALAPTQSWSLEDGRILARAAHKYLTVDNKQDPAELSLQEALPEQDEDAPRQQWF